MTTASARPAYDDALRHYAAMLGFPSLSSYIIWCRKNGLAIQRDNKRTAKRHWQDRPYLYYLRQSPRILRLWMEREALRHD